MNFYSSNFVGWDILNRSPCSKGNLDNLNVSKIHAKVNYPYVKFIEKHDLDVAVPVRPIIFELRPIFMQKWDLEPPKMVPSQF